MLKSEFAKLHIDRHFTILDSFTYIHTLLSRHAWGAPSLIQPATIWLIGIHPLLTTYDFSVLNTSHWCYRLECYISLSVSVFRSFFITVFCFLMELICHSNIESPVGFSWGHMSTHKYEFAYCLYWKRRGHSHFQTTSGPVKLRVSKRPMEQTEPHGHCCCWQV
jgi:hypothetical protein